MMASVRIFATALAVAALATAVPGQTPDLATRWRALKQRLDSVESSPSPDLRLVELQRFVRDAAPSEQDELAVLEARNRLASLHLLHFEPDRAAEEFSITARRAPESAIDLRGHALCGMAEAAELRGDPDAARESWARVVRELAGTLWGDVARVAQRRLDQTRSTRVRAGEPLPDVGALLDQKRSARRIEDLRGKPALLLFVSAADDDGQRQIDRIVRAAREAGLFDEQMLAFAIDTHGRDLDEFARKLGWRMPIIASPDGFVGEALLALEVRGVPATMLVAPDGTLLARELPAARLRELLTTRR